MNEMQELLAEIERVLPEAKWKQEPRFDEAAGEPGARAYVGTVGPWRFVAASFSIENQGFPPGSRGCDGAAQKPGVLVHLTRELAEKAVGLAEKTHDASRGAR